MHAVAGNLNTMPSQADMYKNWAFYDTNMKCGTNVEYINKKYLGKGPSQISPYKVLAAIF